MKLRYIIFLFICAFVVSGVSLSGLYMQKKEAYCAAEMQKEIEKEFAERTLKYKIFIDLKTIEYHHLGNDVRACFSCDGREVQSGDIFSPPSTSVLVTAKVTEEDDISDTAEASAVLHFSNRQSIAVITLSVYENGGKLYPDAYATFCAEFIAEPYIEKEIETPFWQVVFFQ